MVVTMKPARSFGQGLFERVAALILLLTVLPTVLFVALLIRLTAGSPVLVTEPVSTDAGRFALRHRFRTTGPGTPFFYIIGRGLRRYDIDELPALWSVVCGRLTWDEALGKRDPAGE